MPCERCPVGDSTCRGPGPGLCHLAGDPAWDRHILARSGHLPAAPLLEIFPPRATPGRALGPPTDEWDYVTTAMLLGATTRLMAALPPDVGLVVAISRSGLLPGQLLACGLHVPLMTVSLGGPVVDPGHGIRLIGRVNGHPPRRVLLVDDTAARGGAMAACEPRVRAAFPASELLRAVVYCHPEATRAVDVYVSLYPGWHYLEWNWPNAGHGERCGFDMDGILCRDFTVEECATEETYLRAMASVEPLFLPRRTDVPLIVTARPEWTRGVTEGWLRRHGVRWEELVMWPGDAHPPAESAAKYKARHYAGSDCRLFAESDPCQAAIINSITRRPVLCPAAGKVFPPILEKPRVPLGTPVKSG